MNNQELFIIGSPRSARINEGILWALDTTNWGGSPTSPTVTAYDFFTNEEVTDDVLSGSATTVGDVINLPLFKSASVGQFRVIVEFDNDRFQPARPALDVKVVR